MDCSTNNFLLVVCIGKAPENFTFISEPFFDVEKNNNACSYACGQLDPPDHCNFVGKHIR